MNPNSWETWLDYCNAFHGTPWVPVQRRDGTDVVGWWTYPPRASRFEVRVRDLEPVWPEIGAVVGGCPLGLASADSLLAAGVPADYVETLRPLIGLDGTAALAVLERDGAERYAMPLDVRGIPRSAWAKQQPSGRAA